MRELQTFVSADPYAACAVALVGLLLLAVLADAALEKLGRYGRGLAVAAGLVAVAALVLAGTG